MIERRLFREQSIGPFLESLSNSGYRVLAPQAEGLGGVYFRPLAPGARLELDARTALSPKDAFFPMVEEILRFRTGPGRVTVEGERVAATPTVVFGLHPCDARSLAALDATFLSGCEDVFYRERRDATVLVAVSCSLADADCFCTSVGGGPGDTEGSDILLTATGEGEFLAEIITGKGGSLLDLAPGCFEPAKEVEKGKYLCTVPKQFDFGEVREKAPQLFDCEDFWKEQSLRCLGCSTCAFVCPTCSCFDIQDEADLNQGTRLRCWDSCGQKLFTLHASGHNPREQQDQRWRQRLMHKFVYLPEQRGILGCVGCGRCSRSCPAGMNLLENLVVLAEAPA
jgi:sulfhydrogenase subunit beta (sulfur reductase)